MKKVAGKREEGGSNAIKGFLFQFDKTIIEILANPNQTIRMEQKEDIEREKYHIQVKNRESSKYYPSSVRKATKQLFDLFVEDVDRHFCLYCHFADKKGGVWTPTTEEVAVILGKSGSAYTGSQIEAFSAHFAIEFCDDYEAQFGGVITKVQESFGLGTRDLAIMYHAVIRSYLLDLAVKELHKRKTAFSELKTLVATVRSHVSMDGYERLLGAQKYARLVRNQYFVQRRANIDNFQRLFIIEYDGSTNPIEMMRMVTVIGRKYFVRDKSPQPYMLIRRLKGEVVRKIKQGLIDKGFFFNDGTWFDGDKVRTEKLFSENTDELYGQIKFLPDERLLESRKILNHFDEIYEFYVDEALPIRGFENRYIQIPVSDCQQALKILNG